MPKTRSQRGLPAFDPSKEDLIGSRVSEDVMNEMWDALGDSPMGAAYYVFAYLVHTASHTQTALILINVNPGLRVAHVPL